MCSTELFSLCNVDLNSADAVFLLAGVIDTAAVCLAANSLGLYGKAELSLDAVNCVLAAAEDDLATLLSWCALIAALTAVEMAEIGGVVMRFCVPVGASIGEKERTPLLEDDGTPCSSENEVVLNLMMLHGWEAGSRIQLFCISFL